MKYDNFRTISEPLRQSKLHRFKFYKIIKKCKLCGTKMFVQYKVGGFSYNKTICDTCQNDIKAIKKPSFKPYNRLKKKKRGRVA